MDHCPVMILRPDPVNGSHEHGCEDDNSTDDGHFARKLSEKEEYPYRI